MAPRAAAASRRMASRSDASEAVAERTSTRPSSAVHITGDAASGSLAPGVGSVAMVSGMRASAAVASSQRHHARRSGAGSRQLGSTRHASPAAHIASRSHSVHHTAGLALFRSAERDWSSANTSSHR
eukprot:scaffold97482_cov28-Tisochrysis_lutea.AAC.3